MPDVRRHGHVQTGWCDKLAKGAWPSGVRGHQASASTGLDVRVGWPCEARRECCGPREDRACRRARRGGTIPLLGGNQRRDAAARCAGVPETARLARNGEVGGCCRAEPDLEVEEVLGCQSQRTAFEGVRSWLFRSKTWNVQRLRTLGQTPCQCAVDSPLPERRRLFGERDQA